MNAQPPKSSRRSVLNSLLGLGLTSLAAGGNGALFAGPRDRLSPRKSDRRETQVASRPDLPAAGQNDHQREVLLQSAMAPAAIAAETALETIRKVPGYITTLVKREQFKSGAAPVPHTMIMKLRREPFSVYLKFVDPHAGREVLFVDGQNKGKLLVREPAGLASWVGTVSLAPTSDKVMAENRYPITLAGIEKGLVQLLARWGNEAAHPEVEVRQAEGVEIGGTACTLHEVVHPTPRPHFPMHKVQLLINPETKLPVRLAGFGYPARTGAEPPVIEEYTYLNLRTDVQLQDLDFDVNNRNYRFK